MYFENTRPVDEYYKEQAAKGVKYADAAAKLRAVDVYFAPFHDVTLLVDDEGNRYESMYNIGD